MAEVSLPTRLTSRAAPKKKHARPRTMEITEKQWAIFHKREEYLEAIDEAPPNNGKFRIYIHTVISHV